MRKVREARSATDPSFSLRAVAEAADIQPSYLSLVERGLQPPPSEDTIRRLATVLGEAVDVVVSVNPDAFERPVITASRVEAVPVGQANTQAKRRALMRRQFKKPY